MQDARFKKDTFQTMRFINEALACNEGDYLLKYRLLLVNNIIATTYPVMRKEIKNHTKMLTALCIIRQVCSVGSYRFLLHNFHSFSLRG